MRRSRPRTFLELSTRRARAEILHDIVVTAKEPVKGGRYHRLMGLGWVTHKRYVDWALNADFIEERITQRGDPQWRKKPEKIYVATEKGLAWTKIFWDASKPLYGIGE